MKTSEKDEISANRRSSQYVEDELISEDGIIECIDETLNLLGRSVAYTVYLNWSGVDRKRHLGILGDPRSFRTSLYGLFGEDQGSRIEALLVKELRERFPSVRKNALLGETDFVSVTNWLTSRAKKNELLLRDDAEEEKREWSRQHLPSPSVFDAMVPPLESLTKWFEQETQRVRAQIRLLSPILLGKDKEELEKEVTRIESAYDGAIDRQKILPERKKSGERNDPIIERAEKSGEVEIKDAILQPGPVTVTRMTNPLNALADALNACSELSTLARRLEKIKNGEASHGQSSSPY